MNLSDRFDEVNRSLGNASGLFHVPESEFGYAGERGANEYMGVLLDPTNHPPAPIPQPNLAPYIFKRIMQTLSVQMTTSNVLIWTPSSYHTTLSRGHLVTHPVFGNTVFGWAANVLPDENLADNYQSAVLNSAIGTIVNNMRSGALVDIAGNVTATVFHNPVDFRLLDPSKLTPYNSRYALQDASLVDGVTCIYIPQGDQEYKPHDFSGATSVFSNSGANWQQNFYETAAAPTLFQWASLSVLGWQPIFASRVANRDYMAGHIRGPIDIDFAFTSVNAVAPAQFSQARIRFYYVNSAGAYAYIEKLIGAVNSSINFHGSVFMPTFVDYMTIEANVAVVSNGAATTGVGSMRLTSNSSYERGNEFPMYIFTLQNMPNPTSVQLNFLYNYQAVPDINLSKDLDTTGPHQWTDSKDMDEVNKAIHTDTRIKPIYTTPEYGRMLEELDEITDSVSIIGRASLSKKIIPFIKKVGKYAAPFVRTYGPTIFNEAKRLLKSGYASVQKIGYASEKEQVAYELPDEEEPEKPDESMKAIDIKTILSFVDAKKNNPAMTTGGEFHVGLFPIVYYKDEEKKDVDSTSMGLAIISQKPIKAGSSRLKYMEHTIESLKLTFFASDNLTKESVLPIANALSVFPLNGMYITICDHEGTYPIKQTSYYGALVAAACGFPPIMVISAGFGQNNTLAAIGDSEVKLGEANKYNYHLLACTGKDVDVRHMMAVVCPYKYELPKNKIINIRTLSDMFAYLAGYLKRVQTINLRPTIINPASLVEELKKLLKTVPGEKQEIISNVQKTLQKVEQNDSKAISKLGNTVKMVTEAAAPKKVKNTVPMFIPNEETQKLLDRAATYTFEPTSPLFKLGESFRSKYKAVKERTMPEPGGAKVISQAKAILANKKDSTVKMASPSPAASFWTASY